LTSRLPCPRRGEPWSLFLDFDGTLTEIVATPDQVRVDPAVRTALAALHEALGGALAVISGRRIADLDRFFAPLRLPVAGMHGLERRGPNGRTVRKKAPDGELSALRRGLASLVENDARLLLEDKGSSLALHFRRAPEREAELRDAVSELVRRARAYRLLSGKMVLETLPKSVDKGQAIEAYMRQRPYRGRCPVFAGDDVTDEEGFAAVARMGGKSIKVGDGPSAASHRAATVGVLVAWLDDLPERLRAVEEGREPHGYRP